MKGYIFSVQIVFALMFFLSAVAQGDPVVLDPNFYIEKFADVNFPIALEIPPVNSPFGDFLYVSSSDLRLFPGTGPPDSILRVDLTTRQVTTFYNLPAESDPVWMVFGPGTPFTENLYISSNNRDGGQYGDYGGSIVFLEPNPDANGECFLTPPPPPNSPQRTRWYYLWARRCFRYGPFRLKYGRHSLRYCLGIAGGRA